jgi:hypothetical protein
MKRKRNYETITKWEGEECGIEKEKLPLGREEIIRKGIKIKIYLV